MKASLKVLSFAVLAVVSFSSMAKIEIKDQRDLICVDQSTGEAVGATVYHSKMIVVGAKAYSETSETDQSVVYADYQGNTAAYIVDNNSESILINAAVILTCQNDPDYRK